MNKNLKFVACLLCGATLALTACKKDDPEGPSGPQKTDPSTIASSNLIAYFPLDGNGNAAVGNLTPMTQSTLKAEPTFGTGRRGQCFTGGENGFLLYDIANSKLTSLKAFSISMWLNTPQIPAEEAPVPMMLQICKSDDLFWGNLSLTQDRVGSLETPLDSLNLKLCFAKSDGSFWAPICNPVFQASHWLHVIFEYDNITSVYAIYANGVKLTLPDAQTNVKVGEQAAGDMTFANADKMVIGGWMPKIMSGATDEWMGWFKGKMDEVRIYDRALTANEAKALYDAEVANID